MKKIIISSSVLFSLLFTANFSAQWIQTNGPGMGNIRSLLINGSYILAGTRGSGVHYGLFSSTNNGQNWVQTSLNNHDVNALALAGSTLAAGTDTNGVLRSTDNGQNWSQTPLNNVGVFSLSANASSVFAGDYRVYRSTNNGLNWTQIGMDGNMIMSLLCTGSKVFAGTNSNGVYVTTNNGQNWTHTSLSGSFVRSLAGTDSMVFAGAENGIFRTTNGGLNWIESFSYNHGIYALARFGTNLFAGTGSDGIYISTNYGTNWVQRNEGLVSLAIYSLAFSTDHVFAGAADGYVYRRPLAELVGVRSVSNEIPNEFSLSQNYPNPFNPSTTIEFALPKVSFVKLVIYDVAGREIETLVNEELKAGSCKVDFPAPSGDANNLSSGIYFYRLITAGYTETRKMVFLK